MEKEAQFLFKIYSKLSGKMDSLEDPRRRSSLLYRRKGFYAFKKQMEEMYLERKHRKRSEKDFWESLERENMENQIEKEGERGSALYCLLLVEWLLSVERRVWLWQQAAGDDHKDVSWPAQRMGCCRGWDG